MAMSSRTVVKEIALNAALRVVPVTMSVTAGEIAAMIYTLYVTLLLKHQHNHLLCAKKKLIVYTT